MRFSSPREGRGLLFSRCRFPCHPDRSEAERRDLRFYGASWKCFLLCFQVGDQVADLGFAQDGAEGGHGSLAILDGFGGLSRCDGWGHHGLAAEDPVKVWRTEWCAV